MYSFPLCAEPRGRHFRIYSAARSTQAARRREFVGSYQRLFGLTIRRKRGLFVKKKIIWRITKKKKIKWKCLFLDFHFFFFFFFFFCFGLQQQLDQHSSFKGWSVNTWVVEGESCCKREREWEGKSQCSKLFFCLKSNRNKIATLLMDILDVRWKDPSKNDYRAYLLSF